ncbi:MAG: MotA/TolQ/ExbB proton channel family protein [bacterium]
MDSLLNSGFPGPLLAQAPSSMGRLLGVDLIQIVRDSDLVGKLVLLVISGFSVASWAVMLYKFFHIRAASTQSDHFTRRCMVRAGTLEEAYKFSADYPDSPLAQLLREAMIELEAENWYRENYHGLGDEHRLQLAKVGIERVLERTISNEISHLEGWLNFLATTSTVCPFLGLFGTVWGIMGAFQNLSFAGSVALSTIAPNLATALGTTIGGLIAAIPASLMFNYLTNKNLLLISRMDSFALELSNIIQKQLLRRAA